VLIATLGPLAYYARLLAVGLMRPDRVVEPVSVWRPTVTPPDLTAVEGWLRTTWEANRCFSTATIAALLAILALATAAGAFGGPAAAAGLSPSLAKPAIATPAASSGEPSQPPASEAP